jgi:large subunit ribosomal protein L24
MSKWIRKGDKVVIISGNEKGKSGEVIARKEDRVVIQGINIRKKHAKRRQKAPGTEILEMEMSLHISNVALCDTEGKPVKAKVRVNKKNSIKELYYLEGEKEITLRQVRKHS